MCHIKIGLLVEKGVVGANEGEYWLNVKKEVSIQARYLGFVRLDHISCGHVGCREERTIQCLAWGSV